MWMGTDSDHPCKRQPRGSDQLHTASESTSRGAVPRGYTW